MFALWKGCLRMRKRHLQSLRVVRARLHMPQRGGLIMEKGDRPVPDDLEDHEEAADDEDWEEDEWDDIDSSLNLYRMWGVAI